MTHSDKETPLPGQQYCQNGHICSGTDNYCRLCGAELPTSDWDGDVVTGV